jgi:hypothetical protein
VVENDEVAVLEVEAVQLVAGAFRVHDIFVDDEGGAFGVACDALADLTGRFVSDTRSRDSERGGGTV